MEVKIYISDFWTLYQNVWSGAKDTLDTIRDCNLENEFFDWLCSYYYGETPDLENINDLIWFGRDDIAEALGYEDYDKMMEQSEKE